jgi:nicotinate-nucleotide pyrophosphorylase (carboxylating)
MLNKLLQLVEEDLGRGDITSEITLKKGTRAEGRVTCNSPGVLAGLEECKALLKHFKISCESSFADGDVIKKGDVILRLRGDAKRILGLERVMLNLLMRMSGIATETRRLSRTCEKYGVTLAGTRKTTPGFRYFEKKAISIGGGYAHRLDLSSGVLIKDNHIALLGLEKAVARARKGAKGREVEVEVSSLQDALRACRAGASIVMLDNLPPEEVRDIIKELEKLGLREKVKIEVSGGVTPENLEEYARLKPDYISMGYLTTGVRWLDMSMKLRRISEDAKKDAKLKEARGIARHRVKLEEVEEALGKDEVR